MAVLTARGHRVSLASPLGPVTAGQSHHLLGPTHWLGGRLEPLGLRNLARLVRLCRRDAPDALVSFQYGGYLLCALASEQTRVPHVHMVLGPLSPGQRFGAGVVLTVAEQLRDDVRRVGGTDVSVHPWQVDLRHFPVLPPAKEPVVLYASRLEGPLVAAADAFAAAARRLAGAARFCVAGNGPGLDRLRAAGGVELLGWEEAMGPVLAEATIVAGQGLGVVEGMLSGRPAVCIGPDGMADAVTPDTAPRMAYYNLSGRHAGAREPADVIGELLGDADRCASLARWGRSWAAERYDVASGVAAFEAACRRARPATGTRRLVLALTASKSWRTLRRRLG